MINKSIFIFVFALSLFVINEIQAQSPFDYNVDPEKALVIFAVQRYDSTSQRTIDSKTTEIHLDEHSKVLDKATIKLLLQLINDTIYHSDKEIDCEYFYSPRVFVFMEGKEMRARIMMGCNNDVFLFEPDRKRQSLYQKSDIILNEKGKALRDKIFSKLK